MIDQSSILFVDDEPCVHDALRRALHSQRNEWDMRFALSVDEALEILRTSCVDVVVTDVTMPIRDGFDLLRTMQSMDHTRDIPVVIVTGLGDAELKRQALELGAVDLLNKPIVAEDLVARLRNVLRLASYQSQLKEQNAMLEQRVRERTGDLEQSRKEIIWRLAKAGEYRDEQTGHHVIRVGAYSRALAQELGMSREFVDMIFLTSTLHDIGKIGVSDTTLLKNGPLNPTEWATMRQHCRIGYEILQRDPAGLATFLNWGGDHTPSINPATENPFLKHAATIALNHHERWAGGGYPNNLRGEEIPLEARIVTVADVYDALSHARPYKPAYPEEQVISIMNEESPWRFDPEIYLAFGRLRDTFRSIHHDLMDPSNAAA